MIAGCPGNNGSQQTGPGGATATSSGTTNRTVGPGGSSAGGSPNTDTGSASFITLTKVVRSNADPNSLLDLIGQNNEIGTNCPPGDQAACKCVFSWLEAGGNRRESEIVLVRTEANLARCSFSTVSTDTKEFDVTLKIMAAGLTSNTMRVRMPTSNPSKDPSLTNNYLPVYRFMCRDILGRKATGADNTKKYTGLVDPILWKYSYSYNFITTSLGNDYGAVKGKRADGSGVPVTGWECPPIPNDPSDNEVYDFKVYSAENVDIVNPNRITVPDGEATADSTIYPVDDDIGKDHCLTGDEPTCEKYALNRHDYYVSTFKSGIFKQPLCVTHKPLNRATGTIDCTGLDTASGPTTLEENFTSGNPKDIIGWAAMPDQNQRCPNPDVVKIPAGKKWAKLWKFRADFFAREIEDIANPDDIGSLFCTNRDDECMSGGANPNNKGPAAGGPEGVIDRVIGADPSDANRWVVTVCHNARKGGNTYPNFAIGVQNSTLIPGATDRGYGNCDPNGMWGDRWGDQWLSNSEITYSIAEAPDGTVAAGLGNGANDAVAKFRGYCTNTDDPRTDFPVRGRKFLFNCCTDVGLGQGTYSGSYFTADVPADGDPERAHKHVPANYTPDGSICNPALIGSNDASSLLRPEPPGLGRDIWLIGGGNRKACLEADTNVNGRLDEQFKNLPRQSGTPFLFADKKLDADSPRDELYVVTPERINLEDMQDPEGPIAHQYWPMRVLKNAANGDQVRYYLTVGSDNSGTAAGRYSKFPVCVLQDSKKGQSLGEIN